MNKRIYSLKTKYLMVLLSAVGVASIIYIGMEWAREIWLKDFVERSNYVANVTDESAKRLQAYIQEQHLSTKDIALLDVWRDEEALVYLTIYKDNALVYNSFYKGEVPASDKTGIDYLGECYSMIFQDGQATVYLQGFFEYKFYEYIKSIEVAISILVFLGIFVFFIQKDITYIMQLEEEVKVLEGGYLDKKITVRGKDEIAFLAEGLEKMRLSLRENIQKEEELVLANRNLVTGMSHDLRTPLTTLIIYLELLETGKFNSEEEMYTYLRRCLDKSRQIKSLSDQLFERFLITEEKTVDLEEPQKLQYIFEDPISDMIMFLESQGYLVHCEMVWFNVKLAVSTDYLCRILNNISSNIVKYADVEEKIRISIAYEGEKVCIKFVNKGIRDKDKIESTHMGIPNIRLMMKKMNGDCVVREDESYYEMILIFPVVGNAA